MAVVEVNSGPYRRAPPRGSYAGDFVAKDIFLRVSVPIPDFMRNICRQLLARICPEMGTGSIEIVGNFR